MATKKPTRAAAAKAEKEEKPKPKSIEVGGETFSLPDQPPPLFQLELGEQERNGGSMFAIVSVALETFLGPDDYLRLKDVLRENPDVNPIGITNEVFEQYGVSLGEFSASSTS